MKQLRLQVIGDTQLVINQFLGSYEFKNLEPHPYHSYSQELIGWLGDMIFQHVLRKENKKIDAMLL